MLGCTSLKLVSFPPSQGIQPRAESVDESTLSLAKRKASRERRLPQRFRDFIPHSTLPLIPVAQEGPFYSFWDSPDNNWHIDTLEPQEAMVDEGDLTCFVHNLQRINISDQVKFYPKRMEISWATAHLLLHFHLNSTNLQEIHLGFREPTMRRNVRRMILRNMLLSRIYRTSQNARWTPRN